jgi:hypothetical protein
MQTQLADVLVLGGSGLSHNIFTIFVAILIGLIVWALGRFFFPKFKMPEVGMMIWDGLFVLIGAIAVINFLAGLAGHSFVQW